MASLLYRLFGWGGIPKKARTALKREGFLLVDEGISGSLIFSKFRAPGRYYGKRYTSFLGSLALTRERFIAFTFYPFFNPIIDVPLADERLAELHFSMPKENKLHFSFDPARFREDWSGNIQCRYTTERARAFLRQLRPYLKPRGGP